MSGPQVSIVITPGSAAQRLGLSLRSAAAAGEACGAPFEIVVALADADPPTREAAEALDHPACASPPASAADTRAAAELAWGATVILMQGGDLVSPSYVANLLAVLSSVEPVEAVGRPAACVTYGGSPSMRSQAGLCDGPGDRARLVFGAPFASPLAASRSLLVRLPARAWSIEADWAWTAQSLAEGVRHVIANEAVYVAWTPPLVAPIPLPLAGDALVAPPPPPPAPASEAEVAALLYRRAALARIGQLEASARGVEDRLTAQTAEAERLKAKLAAALDEADHARRSVEALRASTSWKATAPLRALASRLKPGGGR